MAKGKNVTVSEEDVTVSEEKEEVSVVEKGSYMNKRKADFTVCGITWKKGESLMVEDDVKEESAFKLAVSLKHLVENK